MNKIYNKIMVSSVMLAILAFGVVTIPLKANAQFRVSPYSNYGATVVVTPARTPTANSNTASTPADTTPEDTSSNLTASAIDSNSYMPSGIIQWLLLAILVLLIVILVRKVFGAEKKYHSTPLKHA